MLPLIHQVILFVSLKKKGEFMKLNIFIIFLLLFIILISFVGYNLTENKVENLKKYLDIIQNDINESNWQKAESNIQKLNNDWKIIRKNFSLIIDHEALHDLDLSLTRLELYLKQKNKKKCGLEIHLSKKLLDDVKYKEKLSLENIF